MGTTLGSTGITFNDATVQTTAAVTSAYIGGRGQAFTASGTFTIPAGVTAVKVIVVGGGGGAGTASSSSGGTSSFGAYCSATGGTYGRATGIVAGGSGTSGDVNLSGEKGIGYSYSGASYGGVSQGGSSYLAPTIFNANNANPFAGTSYGGGAAGPAAVESALTSGGGGGGCAIKYITGLTSGNTVAVTIGAGGAGGAGGANGAAGVVIVEW